MALHGTVKNYNDERGWGFLRRDDGGDDVFVHVSAVRKSHIAGFGQGMRVCFNTDLVKGRPAACDLRLEAEVTDGAAVIAQVFNR